jgi:tRNA (guanine37-N1)-methyltransferase
MRIDILTLFPEQLTNVLNSSILKIAQEKNLLSVNLVNWRDFATDPHHTVDDRPYGGGSGMVLKVDVIDQALTSIKESDKSKKPHVILLSPQGRTLTQKHAHTLAKSEWLVLICGHYEGFDERVENLIDEEISIGDYVLTGGELPALVLTDTLVRLIPGVLGNQSSPMEETFSQNLVEYPQYTRPPRYRDWEVPEILLGGDHDKIKKWREEKSKEKTIRKRPDLIRED